MGATLNDRPVQLLIIDDDMQLCAMLAELLQTENYSVNTTQAGDSGLAALKSRHYDLVILDVMMPGRDGFSVLTEIRKTSMVPVIMLTARGEDDDRIAGFECGADDYLPKPFNPRELLLRIRAILKRSVAEGSANDDLTVGDLTLQPRKLRAYLRDKQLSLTGAELRVLEALMRSPGKIISREALTQFALGRALTPYDRALDTHISNLRAKIGRNEQGQSPIRSMRGTGYLLIAE